MTGLVVFSAVGLLVYLYFRYDYKHENRLARFHEGFLQLNVEAEVGGLKSIEFWKFLLVVLLMFGPAVFAWLAAGMLHRQYLYARSKRED